MPQRREFLRGAAALGVGAVGWGVSGFGHAQEGESVIGEWTGVLSAGSARLRLRLVIEADGTATLYSLDQGAAPIPATETEVSGAAVRLGFGAINARYEAALENGALVGTFAQGSSLPLRFERGDLGLAAGPEAAPLTAERLAALRAESSAPGMAAAARGPQRRILDLAAGVRQHRQSVAVTTRDLWHIGSITKSMTATLTAKLVEQGLLAWDTPLSALLPAVTMQPAYAPVTLLHLLSHRSGLPANLAMSRFAR